MKRILTIILITFIFTSCEKSIEPNGVTSAEKYSTKITQVLSETVEEHKVPGGALLLQFEDGSIFKDAHGFADISSGNSTEMSTEKQFRIGSVTKTFIGTGILILVKRNQIQLSDSLSEVLPGLLKHDSGITIEMLLNQTSSITDYCWTDEFADIYYDQPRYNWTKEKIINLIKDAEPLDDEHQYCYYSNSNYYLLGLIIEKISGKPLHQFLDDEIFNPLQMNNTYLPIEDELTGNFSSGYLDYNQDGIFTEDEDYTSQSPIAIWAAGSIVSTLDDLLIWNNELLSGSLLNSELQDMRMEIDVPYFSAPDGVYYGLGIADIFGSVGHSGAVAGYTTIMFKYNGIIFIAFGNGYATTGERAFFADELFEILKGVLF